MAGKLPFLKFFPDDYLADERLTACSLAAQGFWMRLLCLMHKNARRGYLQQATGKPFTLEQIARQTGCSTEEASRLMQELRSSGVASATEHGILYNRRMVRDAEISVKRSEAGKKGGEVRKPVLLKQNQTESENSSVSETLLKQNLKQNASKLQAKVWNMECGIQTSSSEEEEKEDPFIQPRGGGAGGGEFAKAKPEQKHPPQPHGFEDAPPEAIDLAQRFSFVCTARRPAGKPQYAADGAGCIGEVMELLRLGVPATTIRGEIDRADRNKSEWFSALSGRLMASNGQRPGRASNGHLSSAEIQRRLTEGGS